LRNQTGSHMPTHATVQQIIDAYSSLSDDELVALRRAARCHLGGTKFTEPLDLIHEAIGLLVDGVRHWPMHVDFSRFMFATMRSIAYAERRRLENKLGSARSLDEMVDAGDFVGICVESVENALAESEPARIAVAAARAARVAFHGDEIAQIVIDSLIAGLEPREACANFQISMDDYRAARKRAIGMIKRLIGDRLH
jgi:hypothetical protein